jgi:hypothetical protein
MSRMRSDPGQEVGQPGLSADSDEVAQAFRFDGARDSDMMSPRASGLAGW